MLKKVSRKMKVFLILLACTTMLVTGYFFLEITALAVLVSARVWLFSIVRYSALFIRRWFIRLSFGLFKKQTIKPILKFFGISALITHVTSRLKLRIVPIVSRYYNKLKFRWKSWPLILRAMIISVILLVTAFMGLGLWVLPMGIPMVTKLGARIFAKIQVMWICSTLRRKIRKVRIWSNHLIRKHRNKKTIGVVRGCRYWLIKKDRYLDRLVVERFRTVCEKRLKKT